MIWRFPAATFPDLVWTLLLFDVVNLDEPVQPSLLEEIARDGVVIYEHEKV